MYLGEDLCDTDRNSEKCSVSDNEVDGKQMIYVAVTELIVLWNWGTDILKFLQSVCEVLKNSGKIATLFDISERAEEFVLKLVT